MRISDWSSDVCSSDLLDGDDVELRAEISDLPGLIGTTSETCAIEGSANTTSTVPPPGAGHPAPEHVLAVTEDGRLLLLRTSHGAQLSGLAALGPDQATAHNPAPPSTPRGALQTLTSHVNFGYTTAHAARHQ